MRNLEIFIVVGGLAYVVLAVILFGKPFLRSIRTAGKERRDG